MPRLFQVLTLLPGRVCWCSEMEKSRITSSFRFGQTVWDSESKSPFYRLFTDALNFIWFNENYKSRIMWRLHICLTSCISCYFLKWLKHTTYESLTSTDSGKQWGVPSDLDQCYPGCSCDGAGNDTHHTGQWCSHQIPTGKRIKGISLIFVIFFVNERVATRLGTNRLRHLLFFIISIIKN